LDDTLLSGTIWNYTAGNTNAHGDGWNDEDLSIFSRDQQRDPKDVNSGGRALEAVMRPYARAVAGVLLRMGFDYRSRVFECAFRHDARADAPTEIYLPKYQYPNGAVVTVSDGSYTLNVENQMLEYAHTTQREIHNIRIQQRR